MTKRKSGLTLHRSKTERKIVAKTPTKTKLTTKSPFKSPFKSPLYKDSPVHKKIKLRRPSARQSLFNVGVTGTKPLQEPEFHVENDNTNQLDETIELEQPQQHDENVLIDDDSNEMIRLVPRVMNILEKEGKSTALLNFFRQVNSGAFPLNNIAFTLWTEVVKWYECKTTTNMRYSKDTKMFWKLGWRIFGGKFVNFMGGYKSHGNAIMKLSELGNYSPESSDINFAVPHPNVLRAFDQYHVEAGRKPGIYKDIMSSMSQNLINRSACLTFDGKKLKQGLGKDTGDVDLLGYEKCETLKRKKCSLEEQSEEVDNMIINMTQQLQEIENIKILPKSDIDNMKVLLRKAHQRISENIFSAKELKRRREYCKSKLIERGGQTDWRKGKYVYAISAIIAFIYDIDNYINRATVLTEAICQYIATLNERPISTEHSLNLNECERYVDIPTNKDNAQVTNTRLLKQKSPEWFELRTEAKVTGSTIYAAIGCDGMAKQKHHFDRVVCGVPEKEPSPEVAAMMQHGVTNEINAVATIVGKVMPVIEPELIFCEEGCVTMYTDTGNVFMIVSPDGSMRKNTSLDSTSVAIEIKCPVRKVHTEFPPRYLLQCLSEIEALNAEYLLYVSWTSEDTTVFRVERNDKLLQAAMKIAHTTYVGECPKKTTKMTDNQKIVKQQIIDSSKEISMVARFSSITAGNGRNIYLTEPITQYTTTKLLQNINEVSKTYYELNRERATEAMVFLVADLDRSWEREQIRCSPVAWFPKGYSLTTETLRQIVEDVLTQCHMHGIHIPCQSFDGQWHCLVVRSVQGNPLTVLQLQKDVWKNVEKMKKADIISDLNNMNKYVQWEFVLKADNTEQDKENSVQMRKIVATNDGIRLPKYSKVVQLNATHAQHVDDEPGVTTLADIVPELVREVSDISETVLAMTSVDEQAELEAFSSNVREDEWARELEDIRCTDSNNTEEGEGVQVAEEACDNNCNPNSDRNHSPNAEQQQLSNELLDQRDMTCLLSLFKATKDCNKGNTWDDVSPDQLMEYFTSVARLNEFKDVQLRAIVRYLKKTKSVAIKESSSKKVKIELLAKYLDLAYVEHSKERKRKNPNRAIKSLAEMSVDVISKKLSKAELNICLSEYLWPFYYDEWNCRVKDITVNDNKYAWFYQPDYSEVRRQMEVKCIDSTHLLTRMRRHSCKGGLERLTNGSWLKVARSRKTLLTRIMVEEITDPMSVNMATTHFSEPVETLMRSNNDCDSADLCRDIRHWWESEDKAGIHATERMKLRLSLRKRLLDKVDFSIFPPATMYIAGWPLQLWEGIVASIDAKTLLYALSHSGTYNVRAFSSMIGETFFAELTLNDKRGQGTVSCEEFGQFIGNTIEQVQIRLDPERPFTYCTSRKPVYNPVDETDTVINHHDDTTCRICMGEAGMLPTNITLRNHQFDAAFRRRLAGRRKDGTVSQDRNSLQKGSLGVRWERARTNESKILPTVKMGISY